MDHDEELRRRLVLLAKANTDPKLRLFLRALWAADPVQWVNDLGWTVDPRKQPSLMPFTLFPRQAEFLLWLHERFTGRQSGLVEKSRDMGVTWLCAAFAVWLWLFHGAKVTFGSRKEALVDKKGDPDSIFEKVRTLIYRLPHWLMPKGFKRSAHDNHLRIVNPESGAAITGEGGDNMGRGGRSTIYFKDEAAFIERPQLVEAAVSANTDCCIDVSTPNGVGGPFHTKRVSGSLPVFTFHWRDDPRKDDAWYERQLRELDPVIIAQELEIDYGASLEGILIPREWATAVWDRPLYENERGAITIGGDVAEAGRDKSAAVVREGRNILHAEQWHDPDATQSAAKFIALGLEYEKRLRDGHKLWLMLDTLGVGSGVGGELRRYIKDHNKPWVFIGVKASEASTEDKCHRLRDALWWKMRRWLRDAEPAGKIPTELIGQLTNELSGITYRLNSSGLVEVERKEDLKKRGIASPNLADALMHTFAIEAHKPKDLTEHQKAFPSRHDRKPKGKTWMSQ